MQNLKHYSLKARNFKCFSEKPQGFETIRPVNVIIGRNNTGKSSLLDLIEAVTGGSFAVNEYGYNGQTPEVYLRWPFTEDYIKEFWNTSSYGNLFLEASHARMLGGKVVSKLGISGNYSFNLESFEDTPGGNHRPDLLSQVESRHRELVGNPFQKYVFCRIAADRDIRPEIDSQPYENISESLLNRNGTGATRLVQRVLQTAKLNGMNQPSNLINEIVLKELNSIYGPDVNFSEIVPKRVQPLKGVQDEYWEIFLREGKHDLIPLSQTGSGIKTVLLVLLNLVIYPKLVFKKPLAGFIFAFEELENNLHPAVQRRLFLYLRQLAETEGCYFFLTTHSNVVIDLFGTDPLAQILHVTHDRTCAKVEAISTYLHKKSVLLDLDVRASDLLQSNVVVWVEGPSDRIYFNCWLRLWDGELKEGVHYQCMYTAGSLIEGFSYDAPEEPTLASGVGPDEIADDLIQALRINRHAIVMMDRDRGEKEELKDRVTRIVRELDGMGGIPWITAGREVENYVPLEIVKTIAAENHYQMPQEPGQYDRFFDMIKGPKGGNLGDKKTMIAKRVGELLKLEMVRETLDLAEMLNKVCNRIRDWNGLTLNSHK